MPSDWKPERRRKDPDALERFRRRMFGEPCERCELRPGSEAHHRHFRSQGGADREDNLVWLCRVCHDEAHGVRSFL